MRAERFFRFGGLALVLSFPLLSVLQLGEAAQPWREAAQRVRPSVLALYGAGADASAPAIAACGVVLEVSPPRLVVPGRTPVQELRSRHADGWMRWRPFLTDVEGEFSILQADGFEPDPGRLPPRRLGDLVAAASVKPDPAGRPAPEVEVALVAPQELPEHPLWVGVLMAETAGNGRSNYRSTFLHPVHDTAALSTTAAHASSEVELDDTLRGAPFVDAEGNAVAIFVGRSERGMRALAVETVVQSLILLHLQAAK